MDIKKDAKYTVANTRLHAASMSLADGSALSLPPARVGTQWPEIEGSKVSDEVLFNLRRGVIKLTEVVAEPPKAAEAPMGEESKKDEPPKAPAGGEPKKDEPHKTKDKTPNGEK